LLLVATTAAAEPVDDATRGAARKLGNAGVEAYQAGDFPTAHEKLDKAYRVLKVPSLGLWSARAFVKLGKLVEASERYLEVTRLGVEGGDATVQKQAQADAQQELDALAPRVPSIVVVVQGAKPDEVSVSIDGTPLASALIGESRPANPGPHAVIGKTSGAEAKADVTAVEGKQVTATLVFSSTAAAPLESSNTPPAGAADTRQASGSTLRTVGWITLGVGAAGLVTGVVTGALAASKHSSLEDDERCHDGECLPSVEDDVKSLDTFRTVSTVGFVAGGILAATGLTLVLTAPRKSEVSLRLGPGSARLVGKF
jgi:hypothetical protein